MFNRNQYDSTKNRVEFKYGSTQISDPNPKGSGRRLGVLLVVDRDFTHERGEMLRITQCVSAQGAVKYFDVALCRSDYYTAEHGVWGGKAAQRLGLRGEVTRDDFLALTSNKVPGTERTLTVRTKDNRTAGYDLCFRSEERRVGKECA